jgi:teichuronic acid biosynthesis glycosyltransferase TuaG
MRLSDVKISVIMPAYNAAKYLRQAVESVLAQDYPHWELIIINDGSTDGTGKIAQSFTDQRVIYLEQPNGGVSTARNAGLARMHGEFFCFLDADDVMPQGSLSSRLKVFKEHPALVFVGGAQEGSR